MWGSHADYPKWWRCFKTIFPYHFQPQLLNFLIDFIGGTTAFIAVNFLVNFIEGYLLTAIIEVNFLGDFIAGMTAIITVLGQIVVNFWSLSDSLLVRLKSLTHSRLQSRRRSLHRPETRGSGWRAVAKSILDDAALPSKLWKYIPVFFEDLTSMIHLYWPSHYSWLVVPVKYCSLDVEQKIQSC